MSTYRITNITNLAGKRDFKYNSVLDINYVDGMMKKIKKVKPGDTMFLTVSTLPLSIHRLRVKGLITVIEVGSKELDNELIGKNFSIPTKNEEVLEQKSETKKHIKKKVIK
jgi:hypothetical protein